MKCFKLPSLRTTFVLHYISSYILIGVVLITQFISYPQLQYISIANFTNYHHQYVIRAFLVIGPLMLIEMLTAVRLIRNISGGDHASLDIHGALRANIAIIVGIWLVSFFFALPGHFVLLQGYNQTAYRTILFANWFRVFGWIVKVFPLQKLFPYFYAQSSLVSS